MRIIAMINFNSLSSPQSAELIFNTATHSLLFSAIALVTTFLIRRSSPYITNAALFTVLLILATLPILELSSKSKALSWWTLDLTRSDSVKPAIATQFMTTVAANTDPAAPRSQDTMAPSPLTELLDPIHLINFLGAIWLLGIAIMALRLCISLWHMHRIRNSLQTVRDKRSLEKWTSLISELNWTRRIALRQISKPCSPFAFGLFRPTVVLPTQLIYEGSDQEIEDTLRHELNHIGRYDLWIAALHSVTVKLYWWNPLILCLQRQFNHSREKLCDIAVVSQSRNPRAYAKSLISLAHRLNGFQSLPEHTARMATSFSLLEERIKNIATNKIRMKTPRIKTLTWTACLAAILAGTLTLGIKATWAAPTQAQAILQANNQDTVRLSVADSQIILTVEDSKGGDQTINIPIADQSKTAELLELVNKLGQTRNSSSSQIAPSDPVNSTQSRLNSTQRQNSQGNSSATSSRFGNSTASRGSVASSSGGGNTISESIPSRQNSIPRYTQRRSTLNSQGVNQKQRSTHNRGPSTLSRPSTLQGQFPASSSSRTRISSSATIAPKPVPGITPQPTPLPKPRVGRSIRPPQIASAPKPLAEPRPVLPAATIAPIHPKPGFPQPSRPINPPPVDLPPTVPMQGQPRMTSVPYADWQEQKAQISVLTEAIETLRKRIEKFGVPKTAPSQPQQPPQAPIATSPTLVK